MCWGDVKLCQTSTEQEYLEFNERETKTLSGIDHRNVRAIGPKMFAVLNNEKCPLKAYKVCAEKRSAEMKTDDAPFYLAVNNVKSGSRKPWFKKAPNLVPRAFSSMIFKMADRRDKTLANAELTPSLIGPFIRTR